jgi:hypothetical protein
MLRHEALVTADLTLYEYAIGIAQNIFAPERLRQTLWIADAELYTF